jgi:iron complex outermembrane receptor protein
VLNALFALVLLQQTITRPVIVRHDGVPVAGAQIACGAATAITGADGRAAIIVSAGGCVLTVSKEGLVTITQKIEAVAGEIEVILREPPEIEEAVVVTATRTGRLASDQALRVEVVTREEIEEKLLMTPGDIVMLLNETSGIRLQPTAPALGSASVRVQGLPGRYTPVLTDGLPIHSTQAASLGLLQIPPMDLQQVEIIKGAASALYGASALGGVINLVSKRPREAPEGELMLNLTSRRGVDALLWIERPWRDAMGVTVLAGAHAQNASDVDSDGWADLPRYRRGIVRPRFVHQGDVSGIDLTAGIVHEQRIGGALDDTAFEQAVDTTRVDAGVVWRRSIGDAVLVARGSFTTTAHDHQYGLDRYDDAHRAGFGEVAVSRIWGRHGVVVGGAVERQVYGNTRLQAFEYDWTTPALFVQDDWTIRENWLVSLSARLDRHPEYGAFLSPRVSSLVRAGGWQLRGSAGRGFFAPTALTEESEEVGLTRVRPLAGLDAEQGTTVSVDASRGLGPLEVSATVFGARIADPLAIEPAGDLPLLEVFNRHDALRTHGAEFYVRLRAGSWLVTGAHAWTRATEIDRDGARVDVPLTPRRTWSVIGAWERHGLGRVGVEIYRTGRQRLEDNPFRAASRPYTIVGLLAERRVGRVRVFVNFENLTDVRQSRFDPFLLPAPTPFGRRTVDAWAPVEGRTINGGLRLSF